MGFGFDGKSDYGEDNNIFGNENEPVMTFNDESAMYSSENTGDSYSQSSSERNDFLDQGIRENGNKDKTEKGGNRKNKATKNSPGRGILIIAASAAILMILLSSAILALFIFNPKKILHNAIERTYGQKEANPVGQLIQEFNETGGTIDADISILDESSGYGQSIIGQSDTDKKTEIHADIVKDSKTNEISADITSENNKLQVYYDGQKLILKPGEEGRNIGIELPNNNQAVDGKSTKPGFGNRLHMLFEGIWKNAKVKKAGKQEFGKYKCKKYEVTLKQSEAVKLLNGLILMVDRSQSEQLQQPGGQDQQSPGGQGQQPGGQGQQPGGPGQMPGFGDSDSYGMFGQQQPGFGQEQPGSSSQSITEILQDISQNASQIIQDDVVFDVYVEGGYVRGFSLSTEIKDKGKSSGLSLGESSDAGTATFSLESHNNGDDFVVSNTSSSIKIDSENGETQFDITTDYASAGYLNVVMEYTNPNKEISVDFDLAGLDGETVNKLDGDAVTNNIQITSPEDIIKVILSQLGMGQNNPFLGGNNGFEDFFGQYGIDPGDLLNGKYDVDDIYKYFYDNFWGSEGSDGYEYHFEWGSDPDSPEWSFDFGDGNSDSSDNGDNSESENGSSNGSSNDSSNDSSNGSVNPGDLLEDSTTETY